MVGNWSKILSVILLTYVIIIGFLTPLGVGISAVDTHTLMAGDEVTISVLGYNTHFQSSVPKALLNINNKIIRAKNVEVQSENQLSATFKVPDYLPVNSKLGIATLYVEDAYGTAVLPGGISCRQEVVDTISAMALWDKDFTVNQEINFNFPYRNILQETIRNLYFHVSMWFGMIILLVGGVIFSIIALKNQSFISDQWVMAINSVALLYGVLGIVTGAIWAGYTWGEPWSGDVKQNMSAICLLIYATYFVLRMSLDDFDKKLRVSNAYNIFAFIAMVPLLFIIPRMTESLHPGSGGNPGFGTSDLDNTMRLVFYPAVIGFTLLGVWVAELRVRQLRIKNILMEKYRNER